MSMSEKLISYYWSEESSRVYDQQRFGNDLGPPFPEEHGYRESKHNFAPNKFMASSKATQEAVYWW